MAEIGFPTLQYLFHNPVTGLGIQDTVPACIDRRRHNTGVSVEKCDIHAGIALDTVYETLRL